MLFVVIILVLVIRLTTFWQSIVIKSSQGQYWSLRGRDGDGKEFHEDGVGMGRKTIMQCGNGDNIFLMRGGDGVKFMSPCHPLVVMSALLNAWPMFALIVECLDSGVSSRTSMTGNTMETIRCDVWDVDTGMTQHYMSTQQPLRT